MCLVCVWMNIHILVRCKIHAWCIYMCDTHLHQIVEGVDVNIDKLSIPCLNIVLRAPLVGAHGAVLDDLLKGLGLHVRYRVLAIPIFDHGLDNL